MLTPQEVDVARYVKKWPVSTSYVRFIDMGTPEIIKEYKTYGSIMTVDQAQVVYRILRDRKVELDEEIKQKFAVCHPMIKIRDQKKDVPVKKQPEKKKEPVKKKKEDPYYSIYKFSKMYDIFGKTQW